MWQNEGPDSAVGFADATAPGYDADDCLAAAVAEEERQLGLRIPRKLAGSSLAISGALIREHQRPSITRLPRHNRAEG
jgi:hypothetical protein